MRSVERIEVRMPVRSSERQVRTVHRKTKVSRGSTVHPKKSGLMRPKGVSDEAAHENELRLAAPSCHRRMNRLNTHLN